jgi:hypothetical protein
MAAFGGARRPGAHRPRLREGQDPPETLQSQTMIRARTRGFRFSFSRFFAQGFPLHVYFSFLQEQGFQSHLGFGALLFRRYCRGPFGFLFFIEVLCNGDCALGLETRVLSFYSWVLRVEVS